MSLKTGLKSVWNKMKNFWVENMDKNYRKISIGFGMFLISILISSMPLVSTFLVVTFDPTMADFLNNVYLGFTVFGSLFVGIFFGNEKNGGIEKKEEK